MPWPTGSQAQTAVSDTELTVQIQRGSPDGFRLLYRRHYPAVHGYALTCTRTSLDALELTSHAFTTLLQRQVSRDGAKDRLSGCLRLQLLDLVRAAAVRRCVRDAEGFSAPFRQWVVGGANWSLEEGGRLVQAWHSAPAEIRCLLWHAVVERDSPAQVARGTGIAVEELTKARLGALAAVRYRCATPYLAQMQLPDSCRATVEKLLAAHDDPQALHHCYVCPACFEIYQDLVHVDQRLEAQLPASLLGWWPVLEYLNLKSTIPTPTTDPPFIERAVRQARRATVGPVTTAGILTGAMQSRSLMTIATFATGAAFGALTQILLPPLGLR